MNLPEVPVKWRSFVVDAVPQDHYEPKTSYWSFLRQRNVCLYSTSWKQAYSVSPRQFLSSWVPSDRYVKQPGEGRDPEMALTLFSLRQDVNNSNLGHRQHVRAQLLFLACFGPSENHTEHVDRLLGAGVTVLMFGCFCLLGGHFTGIVRRAKETNLAPGIAPFTALSFNLLVKASIRKTLISL